MYERNSDITYYVHFELNWSFTATTNALLIYKYTCKNVFLYINGAFIAVIEWKEVRDKVYTHTKQILVQQPERKLRQEIRLFYRTWGSVVWYIRTAISKESAVSVIRADELSMYPDAGCGRFFKCIRLHGVTSQRTIFGLPWERQNSQEGKRLEMDSDYSRMIVVRVEHVLVCLCVCVCGGGGGGRTATLRDRCAGNALRNDIKTVLTSLPATSRLHAQRIDESQLTTISQWLVTNFIVLSQ